MLLLVVPLVLPSAGVTPWVMSCDWLGTVVLPPVGVLVAAPLGAATSTGPVLVGCAVVVAGSALAALSFPPVRNPAGRAGRSR